MGLGAYPAVTLAEARRARDQWAALILKGIDPISERERLRLAAREEMDAVLRNLPREDSNMVVRAFSYFSHLANIAEDQHHIRRARAHAHAGAAPREGSLALSLQRALPAGIDAGKLRDSITTRRASTMVELEDGQSFAIAGLLRESVRETVSKYPVLGDIPILGTLFRSAQYQKNETELVIIVTPHFVRPMTETQITLPTDGYLDPDDVDFYLKGRLPRRKESAAEVRGTELSDGREERAREATGLMIP